MTMKKKQLKQLCVLVTACQVFYPVSSVSVLAAEKTGSAENTVFINEIESSDADGGNDWIEIINSGQSDVDISGWFVVDDKGLERVLSYEVQTETPSGPVEIAGSIADGTVLGAGEILVLEEGTDFDFGLGKEDEAVLYNADLQVMDRYSWTAHAKGTYSRVPDGTGDFTDQAPTKGTLNDPEKEENFANTLVINEVNSSPDDWVELMNTGTEELDLAGFELRDNSDDHRWQFPEGTILAPGELLLVDAHSEGMIYDDAEDIYVNGVFDEAIGIGSGDSIRLYDAEGNLLDQHSWTEHANVGGDESASWGRYPDGTGDFVLMPETPGENNECYVPKTVVINEVQSKDPDGGPDWIELANPTDGELDISGIVIKDDDDNHAYTIPDGTVIPAGGFIVFDETEFGFGLGKGDQVRLFENGILIASTTWPEHTNPTWGLYPDVNGTKYQNTAEATPGEPNRFADAPDLTPWPGSGEIRIYDTVATFLEDSSGLDFHDGRLYAVDNGTGKFWILDVAKDGTMSFAEGFENGKTVNYASHASAKGPDTEGITVDGEGYVYLASERDNSEKGVNYNVVLKVDPNGEGTALKAMQEWDLTASLPQVAANTGIEAVEWVSNEEVEGKLFDQNTGAPFDADLYPEGVAEGVFFVALEDNGHVYAYVFNEDGSFVQIADIDPELGGAMALDYDTYEGALWVVTDDGFGNVAAKLTFTGGEMPEMIHIAPPDGLDLTRNNEGFAIADASYTVDGQRPVYRFTDGVKFGALSIGSMDCDYTDDPGEEEPDNTNTEDNPSYSTDDSLDADDDSEDRVENSSTSGRGASQISGSWRQDSTGWRYQQAGNDLSDCWQQLLYNGNLDWYHFDENGYMQVGWLKDSDGHIYYLNPVSDGTKGKMLTGWNLIDGNWYYFNPVSDGTLGALFINCETPDGYRVDENGVWIP